MRGGPPGDVGQAGQVLRLPGRGLPAERVETERAAGGEVGAPLDEGEERLGGRQPAVDGHRREVEQHACEHVAQGVDADRALAEDEPQRGDAVLQVGGDRLPGDGRVGVRMPLAHVPAARAGGVTARAGTPHERRQAGDADRRRQVARVVGRVERLDA